MTQTIAKTKISSSMLIPSGNKMAFLKLGIYGSAGSGKSYTSALIAIGLILKYGLVKKVAVFDTEIGWGFLKHLFDAAGIELLVYDKSDALVDAIEFTRQAEAHCAVLIVDSVSALWKEIQKAFLTKINRTRKSQNKSAITSLEFHHWGPIKSEWREFTDLFLSSKIHFILCGRAGSEYSYQLNERTNKMELITVGNKMATEKEMAYEPSLLIEMVKIRHDNKIINRALVEKDRSDTLNGAEIDSPNFESILSHVESLNIGGDHFDTSKDRDSSELFQDTGEEGWSNEKRMRDIYGEEIKALFVRRGLDGTAKDVKEKRGKYLYQIFGTGSWTAILSMKSDQIHNGFITLKQILEPENIGDNVGMDIPQ